MNGVKNRLALAGIPVASYNANSIDYLEDYKKSAKYRKDKEEKEAKRKAIIAKMRKSGHVNYQKAYEEAYLSPKKERVYKPRLVVR